MGTRETALPPSSPMKQGEDTCEQDIGMEAGQDTKYNLLKDVSKSGWVYQRDALERSEQVSVVCVCVCLCACVQVNVVCGSSRESPMWH